MQKTDLTLIESELPRIDGTERIAMALMLEKERMIEHVMIGTESNIRNRLAGKETELLYDQERPLGTLIFEHAAQDRGWWCSEVFLPLEKALVFPRVRKRYEEELMRMFNSRMISENAVSFFVICCSLAYYYAAKNARTDTWSGRILEQKELILTRSFQSVPLARTEHAIEKSIEKVRDLVSYTVSHNGTNLQIYAPNNIHTQEVAIAKESIMPLLHHYFCSLEDWGMRFRFCPVCGRYFVAQSGHYSLCGDRACEREQNRLNKRAHDNRISPYVKTYNQIRDRLKKKINYLLNRGGLTYEMIQSVQNRYEVFRSQAKVKKKNVRTKNESSAFVNWLFEQEREIEEMLEKADKSKGDDHG